jgi:hypothetical protein
MPRIQNPVELQALENEVLRETKELTVDEIGKRIARHIPDADKKINIIEILNRRGLSIDNCVTHLADLAESQDERVRKDIIFEALTMHGVRNPQDNAQVSINLMIQDGDVKVQNVLLPQRD